MMRHALLALFLALGAAPALAGMKIESTADGTRVSVDGAIIAETHRADGGVDLTQALVDDDGVPLKDFGKHRPEDWKVVADGPNAGQRIDLDPECQHCPNLTLGVVIYRALVLVDERKEPNVAPEDKEAWHDLGKRLLHEKSATLTNDEISLIKARLDRQGYSGLILEQVKKAIDPTYQPPKIKAK